MCANRRETPESVVECLKHSKNLLRSKHISKLRKFRNLQRITAANDIINITEENLSIEDTKNCDTSKQISVRLVLDQVNIKSPKAKYSSSWKKLNHYRKYFSQNKKDEPERLPVSKSHNEMIQLYKPDKFNERKYKNNSRGDRCDVEGHAGDYATCDCTRKKYSFQKTQNISENDKNNEIFNSSLNELNQSLKQNNEDKHVEENNKMNIAKSEYKHNVDENKQPLEFNNGTNFYPTTQTINACSRYYKTAQQALAYLSEEVSSVLRHSFSNIDEIENRVRNTLQAINESTLQYQILKVQAHMPTIKLSEPIQNITQLWQENIASPEEMKQTQSENQVRIPVIENLPKDFNNEFVTASKFNEKLISSSIHPVNEVSKVESQTCVFQPKLKNKEKLSESKKSERKSKHKSYAKKIITHSKHNIIDIDNQNYNQMYKLNSSEEINKENKKVELKSIKVVIRSKEKLKEETKTELQEAPEKTINRNYKIPKVFIEEPKKGIKIPHAFAEELYVPERKINKIMNLHVDRPENIILLSNDSLTKENKSRRSHRKLTYEADNYNTVANKYSNSLWFSSKSKHNLRTSKNVTSVKVSERFLKMHKSSTVIIENAIQTDNDFKVKPIKYKAGLGYFDIVDEITKNDIKPFVAEYPRKDYVGVKTYQMNVKKTYLYKMVYKMQHNKFLDIVTINFSESKSNLALEDFEPISNIEEERSELDESEPNLTDDPSLTSIKKNMLEKTPSVQKPFHKRVYKKRYSNTERCEMDHLKKKMFIHGNYKLQSSAIAAEIKSGEAHLKMHEKRNYKPKQIKRKEDIPAKLKPYILDPFIGYPNVLRVTPAIVSPTESHHHIEIQQKTSPEVEAFLKPYIYDLGVDHYSNTIVVMPVYVEYDCKNNQKKAPPDIVARLEQYMFDPAQQYYNEIISFPALVDMNIKDFPTCKKCKSQILKTSSFLNNKNSSPNVASKLRPYVYDPMLEYPTKMTIFPATVTNFERANYDNQKKNLQKELIGDFATNLNKSPIGNRQMASFSKLQSKSNFANDQKASIGKFRTTATSNLMSYLEKLNAERSQTKTSWLSAKKSPRNNITNKGKRSLTTSPVQKTFNIPLVTHSAKNIPEIARKPLTQHSDVQQLEKSRPNFLLKLPPNKTKLENNIQNVIEMIETKIVDIIASPEKPHNDSFENVEQEIINILESIRNPETPTLKTIDEVGSSNKGSQSDLEATKKNKKKINDEHFEVTAAYSPQQKQNLFIDDVHKIVDNYDKTILEIKVQPEDQTIPTKLVKSREGENRKTHVQESPKLTKREKKYTKTAVQKMIEQKVDSINEIIDNLNNHVDKKSDMEHKIKETKKEVMTVITKSFKKARREKDKMAKEDSESDHKKTVTIKEPKVKKEKPPEIVMLDKEVSANLEEQKFVEPKLEQKENNVIVLPEPASIESGEYLTPFMQALIQGRKQEDANNMRSSTSIIQFLDTLTSITEDVPSPLEPIKIPHHSSNIYYNRQIAVAQILEQPIIYYPINVYNSTSSFINPGGLITRVLNLSNYVNKLVQDNLIMPTLFRNLFGSSSMTPQNSESKLVTKQMVLYKKESEFQDWFLNSFYSMLYTAMFLGLTLNYSCH